MIITVISILLIVGFVFLGTNLPKPAILVMDNAGIIFGLLIGCFSFTAAAYTFFHPHIVREWFWRTRFDKFGQDFDIPEDQVHAIIIPFGIRSKKAQEWLLCWLKPENAAFIYTDMSRRHALELTKDYETEIEFLLSSADIENNRDILADAFEPEHSYKLAEKLISKFLKMGIEKENIFVDSTGGTVPMSIGCFRAAENMSVSTIYLKGDIKNPKNRNQGDLKFISNKTKLDNIQDV